ncbi:MAG: hypothetical protein JXB47_19005 [Anaerolineae bacterium]|nr:hypothetical protein [Anaerolineae bacterium]
MTKDMGLIAFLKALLNPFLIMLLHWLDERDPIFNIEAMRPIPFDVPEDLLKVRSPALDAIRCAWGRIPILVRPVLVLMSVLAMWQVFMPAVIIISLGVMMMALSLLLFPFMPWLWRVPTVISAAVPLAREVEKRRWLILRGTPYSTLEILQALHAAATYRMVRLWAYVTVVRFVVLIVPLVIAIIALILVVLELGVAALGGQVFQGRFTFAQWVAYMLCIGYMLLEPFIDVVVDGWLGVLASTFSQAQLRAMLNGFVLRVMLWGFQVLSLLLVLPLTAKVLTPNQVDNLPSLVLLGPAYGLLLDFSPETTIVMILALAALRILGAQMFMRAALWRAERIESG